MWRNTGCCDSSTGSAWKGLDLHPLHCLMQRGHHGLEATGIALATQQMLPGHQLPEALPRVGGKPGLGSVQLAWGTTGGSSSVYPKPLSMPGTGGAPAQFCISKGHLGLSWHHCPRLPSSETSTGSSTQGLGGWGWDLNLGFSPCKKAVPRSTKVTPSLF